MKEPFDKYSAFLAISCEDRERQLKDIYDL